VSHPALLLRPTGKLLFETCDGLRQQLATAFATGVLSIAVDLTAVDEVDLPGLQVLAGAARHLRKRNGLLVVTGASPSVLSMLRVNGMTDLLEVPATTPLRVVAGEADTTSDHTPVERRLRVVSPEPA
jgi:anti-anti-sigma factor